jgi:hypothetical protein
MSSDTINGALHGSVSAVVLALWTPSAFGAARLARESWPCESNSVCLSSVALRARARRRIRELGPESWLQGQYETRYHHHRRTKGRRLMRSLSKCQAVAPHIGHRSGAMRELAR